MSKPLLILAAAAALAAPAAFAETLPEARVDTARVNFRDASQVRGFYDQLRLAAERVCDTNSANPRVRQLDQRCVDLAVAKAVGAADRPLLTALYSTSSEQRRATGY